MSGREDLAGVLSEAFYDWQNDDAATGSVWEAVADAVLDAGYSPAPRPNAHTTTHVVKIVCTICDHMSYRGVKLGEEVSHDCTSYPVGMTICAWEYEAQE